MKEHGRVRNNQRDERHLSRCGNPKALVRWLLGFYTCEIYFVMIYFSPCGHLFWGGWRGIRDQIFYNGKKRARLFLWGYPRASGKVDENQSVFVYKSIIYLLLSG